MSIKKKNAISFRERNLICLFPAETSPAQPHHAVLRWIARRSRLLGSRTWGQVSKTNIFLRGTEYHAAEFWSKFKLIKFSKSIWPPAQTFDLSPLVLRHRIQRQAPAPASPSLGGPKKPTGAPKASEPCVHPAQAPFLQTPGISGRQRVLLILLGYKSRSLELRIVMVGLESSLAIRAAL